MEAIKEILDAITWHHLAFLFALAFIAMFRQPLSELIRRTTKIGKDGLSAGPTPDAQREKFDSDAVQQLLDVIGNSIVIADIEGRVKTELKKKALALKATALRFLFGTWLAPSCFCRLSKYTTLYLAARFSC